MELYDLAKIIHLKRQTLGVALAIATSITRDVRVPLSNLTIAELLDRATELSCMAGTATTADTRDALHRLAIRFAELAKERAGTGGQPEPSASVSAWQPPSAT